MRRYFVFLFMLITLCSHAQFESAKQIYESPNLKAVIAKHKKVAILPFTAQVNYKRPPKGYTPEGNKMEEDALAKGIQSSMYTFLLRKADKYSVIFQDVEKTNTILKQKGVYDQLDKVTKDSLCAWLGVDAVICGNFLQEKTTSEGAAIAKTVLFGSLGSKTGSGSLTMQINDKTDGEMIWRFFKSMNDDVFSSTDELVERMMRKVSRNFPYDL
jgi:hypothetical protein